MRQEENKFGIRHEEWDGEWKLKSAVGEIAGIPSLVGGEVLDGEENWKEGDVVDVFKGKFIVRAFENIEEGRTRWKDV